MRKYLLLIAAALCSWAAYAAPDEGDSSGDTAGGEDNDINHGGIVSGASMKDLVEQLKEVQAYVFLGLEETRDLNDVFGRSNVIPFDQDELRLNDDVQCTVTNEGIAELTNDGKLTGKNYGETIFTINDKYGNDVHFVVFVTPYVTVVSPEGVIYKYPKTHGQKGRMQLGKGQDYYFINCVMYKNPDGEWEDITAEVEEGKNEGDRSDKNARDGYFEMGDKEIVEGDITFVISQESYEEEYDNSDNGEVVGGSHINARVYDEGYVVFVADKGYERDLSEYYVTVLNHNGKVCDYKNVSVSKESLKSKSDIPENSKAIQITENGIYKLLLNKGSDIIPGHFKVMITGI